MSNEERLDVMLEINELLAEVEGTTEEEVIDDEVVVEDDSLESGEEDE